MKNESIQEQLRELFLEAKQYYGLQKEYLKFSTAEKTTLLLSKIIWAIVAILLSISLFMFLGLALVHWIGEAIGNIGLCYAGFALVIALVLLLIGMNRRKWIVLPIARMISQLLLSDEEQTQTEEDNEER